MSAVQPPPQSAFVIEAERRTAERAIAAADLTLMAPAVFDAMIASLDQGDESTELAELAALPRRIRRLP